MNPTLICYAKWLINSTNIYWVFAMCQTLYGNQGYNSEQDRQNASSSGTRGSGN